MRFLDRRSGRYLKGLEAALASLLEEKYDDRPVADWFDDVQKVWSDGRFYLGHLSFDMRQCTIDPAETDGGFVFTLPERRQRGYRFEGWSKNGTREYSVIGKGEFGLDWSVRVRTVGDGREFHVLFIEPEDVHYEAFSFGYGAIEVASKIATEVMLPLQRMVENRYGFRSQPAFWQNDRGFRRARRLNRRASAA